MCLAAQYAGFAPLYWSFFVQPVRALSAPADRRGTGTVPAMKNTCLWIVCSVASLVGACGERDAVRAAKLYKLTVIDTGFGADERPKPTIGGPRPRPGNVSGNQRTGARQD